MTDGTLAEESGGSAVLAALAKVAEVKSGPIRHVRTPEGVEKYKAPIGTPIVAHPDLPSPPSLPRRREISEMTPEEFASHNFVYHATSYQDDRDTLLTQGVQMGNVRWNLARERFEAGDEAYYGPGAGVGRGTYVVGEAQASRSYGHHIVAIDVQPGDLAVPPESTVPSGTVEAALRDHNGALVVSDIPPERVYHVTSKYQSSRGDLDDPRVAAINWAQSQTLTREQNAGLDALRTHPVNRQLGESFSAAGHSLFLVGGSVRDALAGQPDFADLDYTTDATPEEIHAIVDDLGPVWTIGEEFGTVAVQLQGLKTEITTFRTERYDPDSRKPVVAFGDNIADDLKRRDLTMNASALTIASDGTHPVGSLVDPHDGAGDLAAGILRTPDDPMKSMSEDPLRQLRVVRFAAKRNATPEADLKTAVRSLSDRLDIVAPERKTAELRKILEGGPAVTSRAMALADDLGVSPHLFGGLDTTSAAAAIVDRLPADADPTTILAALAAGRLRSGATGPEVGAALVDMRLSTDEIRPALTAAHLALQLTDPEAPANQVTARGLVRDNTPETLNRAFALADAMAPRVKSQLSLEDRISVAEEVMERGGDAGETINVPPGHLHHPDPEKVAALMPLIEWARAAAASEGYDGWLNLYANERTLAREGDGAQAMVTGGTTIVLPDVTNQMTILHEVAHVVTNTEEGSHTDHFVEVAGNLYERYLGPEAAQTFRKLAGGTDTGPPKLTPLRAAVGAVVDDEQDAVRAPLPVDGNDMLQLGLRGPEIGAALARVRDAFLADPQLGRAVALAIATQIPADDRTPIPNPDPDLDLGDLAKMTAALSGPPSPDGRPKAVIFDRDGTLASVPKAPTDSSNSSWAEYNAALPFDRPVPRVVALLKAVPPGVVRIMTSGRAEGDWPGDRRRRFAMQDWIAKYHLPIDELFMRTGGDMRRDSVVKEELLTTEILDRFDVRFAVDDRAQVVEVWERYNIPTLQVVGPDLGFPIADQTREDKADRHVRTPEGARRYGQPIGSPITPDVLPAGLAIVEHGPSPLDYTASSWIRPDRLAIVDPAAGEHPKGDFGFAELRNPSYYGPSGRRLKNPRIEVTPGAAPGTVGFVDYSMDRGFLKIHYMKTRQDRGGQGLATHLLTQLIETHTEPGQYVDFGKLMNETSARLYEKMQARFPDRKFKAKIWYKAVGPVEEKALRHVRTPEGVRQYRQPIGTPIVARPRRRRPPTPLDQPLTAAFHAKYDAARSTLPDSSAAWFDSVGLNSFDPQWRQMSNGPGPRSLETEAAIRAIGKVVDDEVERRIKAAWIERPLTDAQMERLRKQRDPIFREYNDRKWDLMTSVSMELFGVDWPDLEEDPQTPDSPGILRSSKVAAVINTIHERNPDLAELARKDSELLDRLVTPARPYYTAYATTLASVLGQLRPMGGKLDTYADISVVRTVGAEDAAGPNSGVIPYQWRHVGPWDTRIPRPVNIDRVGLRDYNNLDQQTQKQARIALRKLERGETPIAPKQRGALVGTYSVKLDNEARMLVYPHVDGTWHIYAFIPHHDYHEAERRMADRPDTRGRQRIAAGPGSTAVIDDLFKVAPRDPEEVALLAKANAQAQAAIDTAAARYPTGWIERSNDGKGFFVGQSPTGRGYYQAKWDNAKDDGLFLGNDLTNQSVAIHELAHRMERMNRTLTAAEWAFSWRRTSKPEIIHRNPPEAGEAVREVDKLRSERNGILMLLEGAEKRSASSVPEIAALNRRRAEERRAQLVGVEANLKDAEKRLAALQQVERRLGQREASSRMTDLAPANAYEDHEMARPDKFIDPYIGKDYGDGPDSMYEILSMGMEGVWTGSQPMYRDNEHRQLIVGLLAAA